MLNFLSNLFGGLFQGLINVLKLIFKPIFIVVALLFYFLYKLAELVVTLVLVIVAIGKLLYSFMIGLFNTFASMSYTPTSPPNHGSWSYAINQAFAALEMYQLDKIAYIISFGIWVATAFGVIKILSARSEERRVGTGCRVRGS